MNDHLFTAEPRVALVGAGPGDPGLITLRGAEWLARAEVVVYDRLVNPRLLARASPDAELIYVGKSPEGHTLSQSEINQLLVDRALIGKLVVRLKGGDPYVFGRGGEEAETLADAGIAFEVVPGITSAIAGPSYAGIPVTHRGFASSFAVVTGHEDDTRADSRIDWSALAKGPDTLCLLMGFERLPTIVRRLIDGGRSPATPTAMISWGTWPRQRVVSGELATIVEAARSAGFAAPVVTVVGDVAQLRDRLDWFGRRPLLGQRIVVTRAREQASSLVERLDRLGAEVIEFPTIKIASVTDPRDIDAAVRRLTTYDWIVFTSANGVDRFWRRVWALGADARTFGQSKLCAIGPATAAALAERGLQVDLTPGEFVAEAVADALTNAGVSGQRVLLARARIARDTLRDRLAAAGATVDEVPVYETEIDTASAELLRDRLRANDIDLVTFTSSSTVRNFWQAIQPWSTADWPTRARVAAIGPITAKTAMEVGLPVHLTAGVYTIDGLVEAILGLAASKPVAGQIMT